MRCYTVLVDAFQSTNDSVIVAQMRIFQNFTRYVHV